MHAELLRALFDWGAEKVFLHLDLSGPTTPEADAELARTLGQFTGTVVLPAFRHDCSVGAVTSDPVLPMQAFRAHAWLGAVDVWADRQDILRQRFNLPHPCWAACSDRQGRSSSSTSP